MTGLYYLIDKRNISNKAKRNIFLFINSVIFSIVGFMVWLVVSRFTLSTLDWAICFTGYSGFFIGFIGGFLFLCQKC